MSALVMGLVWDLPKTESFGQPEKVVLLAYADHADANGKNIYPSVALVMQKTFYEERSVQRITRKLEDQGYLVQDGYGPHGTNRFFIPIQRLPDGGAKIAPLPPVSQIAPEGIAPEGIAPEGIAPEPSLVSKLNPLSPTEAEKTDFANMTVEQAYKHPTLTLYRKATGFMPGSLLWESVDRIIRKNNLTEEQIRVAAEAWEMRGYRRENIKGVLDWARDGVPNDGPKAKGAKNGHSASSSKLQAKGVEQAEPTAADRATAERIKAKRRQQQVS